MSATIWSLLPPIIAIVLSLITKQVFISLLVGILAGGVLYAGFSINAIETCFEIMYEALGENIYLILFLIILGMIVYLINKSGSSKAYGEWAAKKMKSQKSVMLATMLLGSLIFIDDYFNCLAVGTIMRPITDKFKISRVKLAYLIDSTAAPVCIIAPISSWAAAVGSSLPAEAGLDGFGLFIQTIPYNIYAWLTLAFVFVMIIRNIEFGSMKKYHEKIKNVAEEIDNNSEEIELSDNKGKVIDLLLPIIVLVSLCTYFILYTGGINEGKGIIQAFSDCDSSKGLALGGFFTLLFIAILYLPRKIISFKEYCDSFEEGAKSMVTPIIILAFAWTLSGICGVDYLNIGGYVNDFVGSNMFLVALIPCIMFVVAAGLSFSSGTSWGTFAILIPISVAIFGATDTNQLAFVISAILAGAIFGDHISPISDTTILASTGAQCNHIEHVSTQMPYASIVAAGSFIGYLFAGLTGIYWSGMFIAGISIIAIVFVILKRERKKEY